MVKAPLAPVVGFVQVPLPVAELKLKLPVNVEVLPVTARLIPAVVESVGDGVSVKAQVKLVLSDTDTPEQVVTPVGLTENASVPVPPPV